MQVDYEITYASEYLHIDSADVLFQIIHYSRLIKHYIQNHIDLFVNEVHVVQSHVEVLYLVEVVHSHRIVLIEVQDLLYVELLFFRFECYFLVLLERIQRSLGLGDIFNNRLMNYDFYSIADQLFEQFVFRIAYQILDYFYRLEK